jgi:translation initiation factor 2B subunit (eIF-2B alpha/beta/delta family)
MTSPQDRITEAVRRGQETVNSTVRTWTDGVQKVVTNVDLRKTVPTLEELVDSSYSFAVQVLAMQRDFTKSLLQHAQPWTETLSNAPRRAEQLILRTERTAAKKAEDVAAKAETVAADAEKTASKAQHSASGRTRSTKN